MKLLLIPFRLAAIPVAIGFWLAQMVGVFLTTMSGWIFYLLAGFMFNISLFLLVFGQSTWSETWLVWIFAFLIFAIPYTASFITGVFGAASTMLRMFILNR